MGKVGKYIVKLCVNDSNDKLVAYAVHLAKNGRYMSLVPEKVVSCFVDADESGRLCVVHIGGKCRLCVRMCN